MSYTHKIDGANTNSNRKHNSFKRDEFSKARKGQFHVDKTSDLSPEKLKDKISWTIKYLSIHDSMAEIKKDDLHISQAENDGHLDDLPQLGKPLDPIE